MGTQRDLERLSKEFWASLADSCTENIEETPDDEGLTGEHQ